MISLNRDSLHCDKSPKNLKILQFGEGNFLRAFADWMVDIANENSTISASVSVVSPRFSDNASIQALRKQDGLYHVILEGVQGGKPTREIRLVKSIEQVLSPKVDAAAYEECITHPDLKLVISNTTEAGIRYEKEDVTVDYPATFPGKVTNLLYKRYNKYNGDKQRGLTFVCCELIEDNGAKLKECVMRHIADNAMPDAFAQWVGEACAFCDSLVDRIVPGFPADTIDEIHAEIGCDDAMVVKGEFYHLWVIGGEGYLKAQGLLPLDKAGLHVHFMPEIKQFRDKKVRILNGSHTGMVPIALQMGCATVLEAFGNSDINRFINDMVATEVLPMIEGDKAELQAFADGILERFYNPYVKHMLTSIALNSLSKWEARNFPTARDYRKATGSAAQHEAFTFAALLALYAPDSGFEPNDNAEHVAIVRDAFALGDTRATVEAIVNSPIFTVNFEQEAPGFIDAVAAHLEQIRAKGMAAALKQFVS